VNSGFIIVYNHYLLKISKLENQMSKLRFQFQLIIWQFVAKLVKVLRYLLSFITRGKKAMENDVTKAKRQG
jgi:hypothetical protein